MKYIPKHCEECLNYQDGKCQAFIDFQPEQCPARIVDLGLLEKRNKEIVEYERRRLSRNPEKEEETVDNLTGPERLKAISTSEILACMAEDMRRGNGKGGSTEKEKAGHKKKKGTKIKVEEWSGFENW